MTEKDMPPSERPEPRRQEGEQDHLGEDAGTTQDGLEPGVEPEYQEEGGGTDQAETHKRGLIDKARDKLTGS